MYPKKNKKLRRNLAVISANFIGQPYELGYIDCFMVVIQYLRKKGVPLPDEFRGYTLATYPELYKENPAFAREVMIDCLDSILMPVQPQDARPGDIVLIKLKGHSDNIFPAVKGGNGTVMLVLENRGVTNVSLYYYSVLKGWTDGRLA